MNSQGMEDIQNHLAEGRPEAGLGGDLTAAVGRERILWYWFYQSVVASKVQAWPKAMNIFQTTVNTYAHI